MSQTVVWIDPGTLKTTAVWVRRSMCHENTWTLDADPGSAGGDDPERGPIVDNQQNFSGLDEGDCSRAGADFVL